MSGQSGSRTEPCGTPKGGKTKGTFTETEVMSDFLLRMEHHLVDVLDV